MGSTGRVTSAVKFGISATVSSVAPTEAFHTTESYGMPLLDPTGRVTSAVKSGISATVSTVAPIGVSHPTESYGRLQLLQHQSGLDWQSRCVTGSTDIPDPCKMSVVGPPTSCRGQG